MVDHFESKVVLITGGNSGIGQATALAFAKKGAKVIVAARRVSEGQATVAMIKEAGGESGLTQTHIYDIPISPSYFSSASFKLLNL
jgi:NAD(P)-dependent dehydrogenase (short-subunit alcohol dehydrogenase family)